VVYLLGTYFSKVVAKDLPHLIIYIAIYSTNIYFVAPNYVCLNPLGFWVGTLTPTWPTYIFAYVDHFANKILI